MKMKIKKLLKQSKIITHQLKNLKTQSGIVEHPKTFHKLSKTKIQAEQVLQVGSNSSLYSDTKR